MRSIHGSFYIFREKTNVENVFLFLFFLCYYFLLLLHFLGSIFLRFVFFFWFQSTDAHAHIFPFFDLVCIVRTFNRVIHHLQAAEKSDDRCRRRSRHLLPPSALSLLRDFSRNLTALKFLKIKTFKTTNATLLTTKRYYLVQI